MKERKPTPASATREKHPQLERLRSLAERDPRLKDALDFAKTATDLTPEGDRSNPRRIRRPYVSAPTLPERARHK